MMSLSLCRSLCLIQAGLVLVSPVALGQIVIEERSLSQLSTPVTPPSQSPAPAIVPRQEVVSAVTPAITAEPIVIGTPAPSDNTGTPVPESGNSWQLYSQLQQMQEEVAQLRGMVEEQGHLIERLQNDLRTRYTDLDQRLQVQQDRLQTPPTAPAATADTGKATAPVSSVEDEKKAYLAAYDTFRQGGADKAIAPMLAFVKQYPDSSLTPGAHYWLGEFYLNATRPDQVKARQQFDAVLAKYPDNTKAPAALYKIASILDLQGKPDEARQKMQELMKRYPKSPEASLADTWLKTLQAAQTPAKPVTKPAPAKPAANKR